LPSYAGALQVFKSYGGLMVGVKSDDDGMRMDDLEVKLEKLKKEGEHYKFIYIIPDFQNPSGITLSQERREQMVRLSREYDVIILEDSPYRKIRFEGRSPDMLYKLDTSGNVISLFTFSKTFAPGFRLGYIVGNEAIIKRMAILKQSMDLCSSPFAQLVAAEFLRGGYYQEHVKKVVKIYKAKKDHMLAALARYMPEGVTWTKPEGGLFLWLRLPETMDGDDLFSEALKENVAYVVGSAFHCDGAGRNTMRLNFSYSTPEKIDEGIKRLATVFKKNWKK